MAVEHEELRLSVTLDDQASAQLGALQAALNNIGGAVNPTTQGLNQLAAALKGAGGHAQQLHGSLAGMAAKGGFIGGFFAEIGKGAEEMAKDLANAVFNVKQYADAMVNLEQSARRASTSAAQFQRNVSIFRESGVAAGEAAKNLQGFADALGNLQREESTVRTQLFRGLNPAEFQDMAQFLRRVQTSDRETGMQLVKQRGQEFRDYWIQQGKPERGAIAQSEFYRLFGMPDLDKLRDPFQKITPELQQMYALRMANAGRMQTAVEKTSDATERGVRSVQASALYALPITEAFELVGEVSHTIAHWLETWETSISGAEDALDKNRNADSGFWFELFKKLGIAGGRTRGDELGPTSPQQDTTTRSRRGPTTRRLPLQLPGEAVPAAPQQFTSGAGGASAGGGAVGLGVGGAVDRLPEEYEEIGGRMIEDRRAEGSTFPGRVGDPIEDNTTEMEALANELRRLNDFLAPSNIMNPAFHNAPQGGAEGESNPMELTSNIGQPGGGAAAEARQPPGFRPGFKGKPNAPLAYGPYAPLPKTAQDQREAAIRYNNPGAAFPASTGEHLRYGSIGYGQLPDKDRNLIARFNDPVLGAAYNFSTYERRFVGKPIGAAMSVWSGGHRAGTTGYDPKTIITKEMLQDPEFAVPYMMAVGGDEAAKLGITEAQMRQAHAVYQAGGVSNYASSAIDSMVDKPGVTQLADLDPELRGGGTGATQDTQMAGGGSDPTLLIRYNPYTGQKEPEQEPRALQRAVEGIQPGSDLEWQLRTERALQEAGPGFSETQSAQPPMNYGPGTGLLRPGELQREAEEMERSQRLRDEFNPNEQTRTPSTPSDPSQIGGFDPQTGKPLGTPIRFDPSALDGAALDRAESQRIDVDTSGMFSVNVSAPEGTTVRAEGEGMLERTELNRSMPPMEQQDI